MGGGKQESGGRRRSESPSELPLRWGLAARPDVLVGGLPFHVQPQALRRGPSGAWAFRPHG